MSAMNNNPNNKRKASPPPPPNVFDTYKHARVEMQQQDNDEKYPPITEDIISSTIIDTFLGNDDYQLLIEKYWPSKLITGESIENIWYVPKTAVRLTDVQSVYGTAYGVYTPPIDTPNTKQEDLRYIFKEIKVKQNLHDLLRIGDKKFQDTVTREIRFQQKAASVGVALPIYDAWATAAEDDPKYKSQVALMSTMSAIFRKQAKLITVAIIVMGKADLTVDEMVRKHVFTKKGVKKIKKAVEPLISDLHEKARIAHNDLHANNIMYVKKEDRFYIIDFGMATDMDNPKEFKGFTERERGALDWLDKAIAKRHGSLDTTPATNQPPPLRQQQSASHGKGEFYTNPSDDDDDESDASASDDDDDKTIEYKYPVPPQQGLTYDVMAPDAWPNSQQYALAGMVVNTPPNVNIPSPGVLNTANTKFQRVTLASREISNQQQQQQYETPSRYLNLD